MEWDEAIGLLESEKASRWTGTPSLTDEQLGKIIRLLEHGWKWAPRPFKVPDEVWERPAAAFDAVRIQPRGDGGWAICLDWAGRTALLEVDGGGDIIAPVAQRTEQPTSNRPVGGSNPPGRTVEHHGVGICPACGTVVSDERPCPDHPDRLTSSTVRTEPGRRLMEALHRFEEDVDMRFNVNYVLPGVCPNGHKTTWDEYHDPATDGTCRAIGPGGQSAVVRAKEGNDMAQGKRTPEDVGRELAEKVVARMVEGLEKPGSGLKSDVNRLREEAKARDSVLRRVALGWVVKDVGEENVENMWYRETWSSVEIEALTESERRFLEL